MFDITFKEVDNLTRQAETRAHQLGPSWARQSPVALDCGQARVGDLILTIQLHYIMADHAMTCIWNIIIFRVKHWIELGLANVTLNNLREMPNNIAYNQFPTQNKKLEGDAKWHRIQSVSHTLIFQVFFNITSVLEFVYSHFFTLYLICMWLLFIMPVIKLLFLTIVLPGDFVVARRAFWGENEMAILVARTNLPVWDFQKLASLMWAPVRIHLAVDIMKTLFLPSDLQQ